MGEVIGLRVDRQALVVQTSDSAIHCINHYPADKYQENRFHYPLDSVIHLLNNWAQMLTSLLLKKFIRLEISNIYSNVLKAQPEKVEQESENFKRTLVKKNKGNKNVVCVEMDQRKHTYLKDENSNHDQA